MTLRLLPRWRIGRIWGHNGRGTFRAVALGPIEIRWWWL